jgi:uncharacterized protein YbjT (DUF2867 family)
MENFTGGYALRDGALVTGLEPNVPQQVVAVDDLGVIAALAFGRPHEWIGRVVDLAGDELTPAQMAAAIADAIRRPLPYVKVPIDTIRQASEDFAFASTWLNERGYRVDIPATRRIHPGLMDFRTWLDATGAAQITAFLDARRAGEKSP